MQDEDQSSEATHLKRQDIGDNLELRAETLNDGLVDHLDGQRFENIHSTTYNARDTNTFKALLQKLSLATPTPIDILEWLQKGEWEHGFKDSSDDSSIESDSVMVESIEDEAYTEHFGISEDPFTQIGAWAEEIDDVGDFDIYIDKTLV